MTTPTTTLTAGEIAQYIQRPDEPLGAAIARFRNWEKMGIIKATGERNPGTGRKKQYSPSALLEAVLLQRISDELGAPAVTLKSLIGQLSEIVRAGAFSWGAQVIVLGKLSGEHSYMIETVNIKNLGTHISSSQFDVHVILNLNHMFRITNPYFHEEFPVPEWMRRIVRSAAQGKLSRLAAARHEHERAEAAKRKRSAKSKSKS